MSASDLGREEHGRILGYGCRECETVFWKGAEVHPLRELASHLSMYHKGDRSVVVIVRDEAPFDGGEV